jgi:hyaluronate lyase
LQTYRRGPVSVLANNERVQAIRHAGLGVTAANVFANETQNVERLAIDGAASVIVQRTDNTVSVAVSDPTMNRSSVSVVVRGPHMTLDSADDGVDVERVAGGTRVTADTHEAYGATFTATLRLR